MTTRSYSAPVRYFLGLGVKIVYMLAVVLLAVQVYLGVLTLEHMKGELIDRFYGQVIPMIAIGDIGTPEMKSAILANDRARFDVAVEKLVETQGLFGKIVSGVEAAEDLIKCHRRLFCTIDNYQSFEPTIYGFWFTFHGSIETRRGTYLPSSFGSILEAEAKRIKENHREIGGLPQ
ncbi:hypothetical protein QO002_005901 [Pararhizobium capsulatum DSM 1112]|uniref:Uncharacterized protein n=1 Tax=Pararhizobium capsulatum DSM 1112 TaxID=1121113 RepID=A0ABU0C182_9HYPH|nr:hypothetical protein [Pararhizobium capsulatum]MDQ0323694.1 hypothetical protein [Pararhizobium capsulatum DSM 1112]